MTASLLEAFGDNYEAYPPDDMQKKKKKSVKLKKYGKEVVSSARFIAPEPRKELNVTLGGYPEEDNQYLQISSKNEYGPTDYNIKPKDVQEYVHQMKQNVCVETVYLTNVFVILLTTVEIKLMKHYQFAIHTKSTFLSSVSVRP